MSIQGFVEASDGADRVVSFIVELRPGWFFGPKTDAAAWEIELSIETDCARVPTHGRHTVRESVRHASTPEEAARSLRHATTRIVELATQRAVSAWTSDCPQ
jgi:hypothetical protein